MSTQHPHSGVGSAAWSWPIAVEHYDRTFSLTADEMAALDVVVRHLAAHHATWPRDTIATLHRLLHPLQAVLTYIHASPTSTSWVRSVLAHEMHVRGTAYWAWTEAEWLTVLRGHSDVTHHYFQGKGGVQSLMAVTYLLCDIFPVPACGQFRAPCFARKVFGTAIVDDVVQRVCQAIVQWGHGQTSVLGKIKNVLCLALLVNRSPRLEDLTFEVLANLPFERLAQASRNGSLLISRALVSLNIITRPLPAPPRPSKTPTQRSETASDAWVAWCERWNTTTILSKRTREHIYSHILAAGRWLAVAHPDITSPGQWTRELAAEFVSVVDRLVVGQWTRTNKIPRHRWGKPIMPRTKKGYISSMRTFFIDCQEQEWIPRRFDPQRAFEIPRAVRNLIGPDPRIIADDIWAKLLAAGLNLTENDLPTVCWVAGAGDERAAFYPLEMIQAVVIVWLFAALRKDEIRRLRVGCVRWYHDDVVLHATGEILPKDAVCKLTVPTNKTSPVFVKAVDRVVGEAVEAWERVRPAQPAVLDAKTNEYVTYLFCYRGHGLGAEYINQTIIPLLCRKAGVPEADARGRVTSHRARATIASQLLNAKEGLTLDELREWLGHKTVESTRSYAKPSPTKVAKSYEKADYFRRNLRTIDVLIDQAAIKGGAAATGEPYMYYDLGHGYCVNDFFATCPHRMACARCDFYRPKSETRALLGQAKQHLIALKQDLKLTELEMAAIDGDLTAIDKLSADLAGVPTPAGPTPRQLAAWTHDAIPLLPSDQPQARVMRSEWRDEGKAGSSACDAGPHKLSDSLDVPNQMGPP